MDYKEDYYTFPANIYFNMVVTKIVELGKLNEEKGLILDYGCGFGHIRRRLHKGVNIIWYDIIPELSKVKNYEQISPRVVIFGAVLEHLQKHEIEKLVKHFKKKGTKKLIISLPTENWLSKVLMHIVGQSDAHEDHITTCLQAKRILSKHYNLIKRTHVLTMMEITAWEIRK